MVQAFKACPVRHTPAVAFAYFPTVARLLQIKISNPELVPVDIFNKMLLMPGKALSDVLTIVALGNGFILTAMLWGGMVATMIDRKLKQTSIYLIILSVFTFFGLIHSAIPEGNMYFPWTLRWELARVPYQFATGYLILAVMMFMFSYTKESKEPFVED